MGQGFYGFPNVLALLRTTYLKVLGKPGATAGAGLAGGTTSGAPASGGPFDAGDLSVSHADGALWVCTAAGSPGTWSQIGTSATTATSAAALTNWFNVKAAAYGALGDGSTDDTAAIQAAIDACGAAGGGVVYFPAGVYVVGGALADTSHANAQLLLPARSTTAAEPITVLLLGESPPPQIPSEAGTVVTPTAGSILKGTLNAGAGGALLGCANGADFSMVEVVLQNLTLRLPSNPVLSAANLALAAAAELVDVVVDSGSYDLLHMTQPTTSTSYGVKLPGNNNGAWTYCNRLSVIGYYTGVLLGEHTVADELGCWTCVRALEAPFVYHASHLGRLLVVWCPTGLRLSGTHALAVEQWDVEHHSGGAWYDAGNDVDDGSNQATGAVSWWAVLAGTGVQNSFVKNGGTGLLCTRLGAAPTGSGTVTSVGLTMPAEFAVASAPVTGSGTIAVSKATQASNLVYSGPASGAAAIPTFRALVAADVGLSAAGDLLTRTSSALARLGVGADGTALVADSSQSTGLAWSGVAAAPSSLLVLLPNPYTFSFTGTDVGQPPDFITLANGDVVGVGGL